MGVTETILYDVTHTFLISDRTKVVNLFGICKQINIFNTKKIHPPLWYVNGWYILLFCGYLFSSVCVLCCAKMTIGGIIDSL